MVENSLTSEMNINGSFERLVIDPKKSHLILSQNRKDEAIEIKRDKTNGNTVVWVAMELHKNTIQRVDVSFENPF